VVYYKVRLRRVWRTLEYTP